MFVRFPNPILSLLLTGLVCNKIIHSYESSEMEESQHLQNQNGEYCQNEFFTPKCPPGKQIFIESAKYGRMNVGKCIKEQELTAFGSVSSDPKYFGCQSDVTTILHNRCSFSKDCSVEVKDKELNQTAACYPWVKSHLQVTYQCLHVIENEEGNCRTAISQKAVHLIVDHHSGQSCGISRDQPWIFETFKGQTVKVIQKKFSAEFGANSLVCKGVGVIIAESRSKRNVTICSGSEIGSSESKDGMTMKEEVVFKSKSGIIEVFKLTSGSDVTNLQSTVKLILKFEADGCLDIIPPEDTWLKRNNDDIVIGCYSSKHTWYLRCENGKWIGTVGNCSSEHGNNLEKNDLKIAGGKPTKVTAMSEENQILIIIAISSFGVVVCILIICCGAMFVKRFKGEKSMNLAVRESYYRKDTMSVQPPFYGPFSQSTMNKTAIQNGQSVEGEEEKYFVLDENIIEKHNEQ